MNEKGCNDKSCKKLLDTQCGSSSLSGAERLIQIMLMDDKNKLGGPLKTFAVERSTVLDRVKAFLPQIEESNATLQTGDPSINIENISDDHKDSYIEMSLACVEDSSDSTELSKLDLLSTQCLENADDSCSSTDDESSAEEQISITKLNFKKR